MKDVKIESPSPIQKKIYKAVQEGSDLVINTTKDDKPEVGYLISLLNDIAKTDRRQGTKGIILTGNSERAKFLDEWIWAVGYHASIESACITSDGDADKQLNTISAGPVVLVATPTELSGLLESGRFVFREVKQLIVDQADQIDDWAAVESISTRIIGSCQRVFTAAKDSKDLREAENNLLTEPELVTLAKKSPAKPKTPAAEPEVTKDLTQYYINVPPRSKISTLMAHLENNKTDTVVIFTASRRTADRLYKILRKSNKRAVSIHEQLNKETFEERFGRFTSGDVQHLIIGEKSAKDLPLEHATQVINYDVPEEVEEYKLRAELVGDGKATRIISLVSKQDRGDIQAICKSLGYAPEEVPLPKSVKDKISTSRKGKKKSNRKSDRSSSKKSGRGKKRTSPKKNSRKVHGLPRPTFDQLEGGRTGKKKEEKKGLVGFFKNLFS